MFKSNISMSASTPFALFIMALVLASTNTALAASGLTLGTLLCNGVNNARPMGNVFNWVAYVSGAISAVAGIYHLRLHSDSPQNNKLTTPLMYFLGGIGLLTAPHVVSMLIETIYGGGVGKGTVNCTEGAISGGPGLDQMLKSFVGNIRDPLQAASSVTAVLAGMFFIVRGLIKSSKYGTDPKTHNMHSILTHLGFGALLMTIGANLNVMLASVFGDETISSTLNWGRLDALIGAGGVSQRFKDAVNAALVFVQLIGCIAFVRGWLIMKKVVEGGSGNVTLASGITHILGGVLAINIYKFLVVMDKTFGTNLVS